LDTTVIDKDTRFASECAIDCILATSIGITQFRLDSELPPRYRRYYEEYLLNLQDIVSIGNYHEVNHIKAGYLAEALFFYASSPIGMTVYLSDGIEDINGTDFFIKVPNGECMSIDVSKNISDESIREKSKPWTSPTVFVPWRSTYSDDEVNITLVEKVFSDGYFNIGLFWKVVLDYNWEIYKRLREDLSSSKPITSSEYLDRVYRVLKLIQSYIPEYSEV
jgi:hypothetical protein